MEAVQAIKKEKVHLRRLGGMRKDIFKSVADAEVWVHSSPEPISPALKESLTYRRIYPNCSWGKMFGCAWLRVKGQVPHSARGEHVVLRIDVGGEGLVYEGVEPVVGVTNVSCYLDRLDASVGKSVIEVTNKSKGDEKIDLYLDCGYNGYFNIPIGRGRFKFSKICVVNDSLRDFYYDYLTVTSLLSVTSDNARRQKINLALDESYEQCKTDVKRAQATLSDIIDGGANESMTFTAVGHSHLDLAWLWPLRETKRKAARTFANQMTNMEQFPDYIYGASQPQQFEYIKHKYPEQFAKLKQKIASGQMEAQGGMWVEADTNISSGESLIRQIYYGKKFFRDEFGQEMKICWLPDVFGYNGNLPQILVKSGLPYFMTIKLSWNEHNRFPFRSFNWYGIDDSQVLVHMAPDETYNSAASPACAGHAMDNYTEKDVAKEALMIYGVGDGGGGPSRAHIELVARQNNLLGSPRMKFGRAIDFFDRLKTVEKDLPEYKGELYLEKHQGTYTTQGANKRFNRKSEYALQQLESLLAIAYLFGYKNVRSTVDKWWKEILLYQFHDIIPGSSINRVYVESRSRYKIVLDEIQSLKNDLLDFLKNQNIQEKLLLSPLQLSNSQDSLQEKNKNLSSSSINEVEEKQENIKPLTVSPTEQGEEKLLAYNPTSFFREEYVKFGKDWFKATVQPFGFSNLELFRGSNQLKFDGNSIENAKVKVIFAPSGEITSFFVKDGEVEYAKDYLNRLYLYTDKPLFYNAWDIDWEYYKKPRMRLAAYKHESFIDGARVVRRNYYRHLRTVIIQEVELYADSEQVNFVTNCDYREIFKMLRADFLPTVNAERVKCDIQLGSIYRSTKEDTSVEKAQFEICAHKYVDVSDNKMGLSLLNDCKYGHRVKNGLISLNLLRSTVFPDGKADRHEHTFTYALYPHKGDCSTDTLKRSYFLNIPLTVSCGSSLDFSFARSTNQAVVIDTVKPSYDGLGIIVRAFESEGRVNTTKIDLAVDYAAIAETNLMEEGEKTVENSLTFAPYEIKTLKFTLKK